MIPLFLALFASNAAAQDAGDIILTHDFRTDPSQDGWQLKPRVSKRAPQSVVGRWTAKCDGPDAHSLQVSSGYWESSAFKVTPHRYYRLTFQSKAGLPGYWAAMFYDRNGRQLDADNNSEIEPSNTWAVNERFFQAKADAGTGKSGIHPVAEIVERLCKKRQGET